MVKLLTPVNFGSLALSHRIVLLMPFVGRQRTLIGNTGRASIGLVIQAFPCGGDGPDPFGGNGLSQQRPKTEAWSRANDSVRTQGGMSFAQITYAAVPGLSGEPQENISLVGCRDAALSARAACFDGVELNAEGYVPSQPEGAMLEAVQMMIDAWGADRVGVQLAPFAWMTSREDQRHVESRVATHILTRQRRGLGAAGA